MGLIRFVQSHNRNKELKKMRELKERELSFQQQNQISKEPSNRNCPSCNKEIPFDADICPYCGKNSKENNELIIEKPLESDNSTKYCTECGAKLSIESKFCHECGFDLRNKNE